jgi:hypothetical protein
MVKKRFGRFLLLLICSSSPAWAFAPTDGPFLLSHLQNGLNNLSSPNGAKEVLFFIHGINEDGASWDNVLRPLVNDPKYVVFFFKWNKRQSPEKIQTAIGESLNRTLTAYSDLVERFTVVAHSAGGVLLLNSLCFIPGSANCVFRPELDQVAKLSFHTIASPLGGFHYPMTWIVDPLIGRVTSFVGGHPIYKHTVDGIELNIWETQPENDPNARVSKGFDNRIPQFAGKSPQLVLHELSDSSHTSAIPEALEQILRQ